MAPSAARPNPALFDAPPSGKVLNLRLLRRLLRWMRPYRTQFAISGALILAASALQVLLPVVISLVAIDQILLGGAEQPAPDLGMQIRLL